VTREWWIGRGKSWPAPAGVTKINTFQTYRYDPDSGESPGLTLIEDSRL
jgi:succinate dehydrogenase / fumarate reductase iron-sulfur subunit